MRMNEDIENENEKDGASRGKEEGFKGSMLGVSRRGHR
jgi:hypothetical protein